MIDSKDASIPSGELSVQATKIDIKAGPRFGSELRVLPPKQAIIALKETSNIDLVGGSTSNKTVARAEPLKLADKKIAALSDPEAMKTEKAAEATQIVQQYPDIKMHPDFQQRRAKLRSDWNQNHSAQEISDGDAATLDKIALSDFQTANPDVSNAYDAAQAKLAAVKQAEVKSGITPGEQPVPIDKTDPRYIALQQEQDSLNKSEHPGQGPMSPELQAASDQIVEEKYRKQLETESSQKQTSEVPITKTPEMSALEPKLANGTATTDEVQQYQTLQQEQLKKQGDEKIQKEKLARKKKLGTKLTNGPLNKEEDAELKNLTAESKPENQPEAPTEKTDIEKTDELIARIKKNKGMTANDALELAELADKSIVGFADRIDDEAQQSLLDVMYSTPELLEKLRDPSQAEQSNKSLAEFVQAATSRKAYRKIIEGLGAQLQPIETEFDDADQEFLTAQTAGKEDDTEQAAKKLYVAGYKLGNLKGSYTEAKAQYRNLNKTVQESREKMLSDLGINETMTSSLLDKFLQWLGERLISMLEKRFDKYSSRLTQLKIPNIS